MKVRHHIAASLVVSGILFAFFRSWSLTLSSFAAGILIDIDHAADYLREHGWRFDIRYFLRTFPEGRYKRIHLVLHGWEWLVVLAAAAWLSDWNGWITGILAGFTQHLVLDQIFNPSSTLGYSLFWRIAHGFDPGKAFPRQSWRPEHRGPDHDP